MKIIDYSKNPFLVSDTVKRVLRYKKSGSALDMGTGTGRNALFLAKKGFEVTALDVLKKNLTVLQRIAREQGVRLRYVHANVLRYRPRKKFDVVVCRYVLHFLKPGQVQKAIEAMQAYTKPGGLNIVAVHTTKNPRGHRPKLFKENELKEYYRGWEILSYAEKRGLSFRVRAGEKPVRRHKAELIARKP